VQVPGGDEHVTPLGDGKPGLLVEPWGRVISRRLRRISTGAAGTVAETLRSSACTTLDSQPPASDLVGDVTAQGYIVTGPSWRRLYASNQTYTSSI
jgi:hypothetical protein